MLELLAQAKPAGGAALDQVAIATGAAGLITVVLLWLGMGHRSGKVALLGRLGRSSERVSGMPAWLAIPSGIIVVSLITALFGMFWDISLHIADGRDEGPLANVAHYFILAGLFGVFAAGFLSMCLPLEKPSRVAVQVAPGWYAPLGGVLIASAGTFALIGFPLDDVWHRLFGQDVTLWGPTHLMLIGGAAMTLIGLAVLFVEAGGASTRSAPAWVVFLRRISLPGALLLGLSTFQAEFDFGVPQFRMIFQPMLIMLAAGVALVATRIWLGRGAALGAALFFLAMRGAHGRDRRPVSWVSRRRTSRSSSSPRCWSSSSRCACSGPLRWRSPPARCWAPSGSPPSGVGRTSSCRCRGPRRCCRKG